MGQKDISEKTLVDYNDVFADIVNVCVYEGKEVVKPDDLEKGIEILTKLLYQLAY